MYSGSFQPKYLQSDFLLGLGPARGLQLPSQLEGHLEACVDYLLTSSNFKLKLATLSPSRIALTSSVTSKNYLLLVVVVVVTVVVVLSST